MGKEAVEPLTGYIRVSTTAGRDDERFRSPELQRRAIETWANTAFGRTGHSWVGWYQDLDVTGTTQIRPGLVAAKEAALARGASIVVYDLSRWSRSVEQGLADLRFLHSQGINVFSATERIDPTTASGMLNLNVLMAMNQFFAESKSEGWRGVIENNRSQGLWHGRVPYGYRRPTEVEANGGARRAGVIIIDNDAAHNVRWAFEAYVSGMSMYEVGVELLKRGVFRRHASAVDLLRNPVYIGQVPIPSGRRPAIGKAEGYEGKALLDARARPRYRRHGEIVWREGTHAPIVERDVWDMARARDDAERVGPRSRRGSPGWWGATLVRCGGCGRVLTHSAKPSGEYLICHAHDRRGCNGVGSVKVNQLEVMLLGALEGLTKGLRTDARARARRMTTGGPVDKRHKAKAQLDKAQRDLGRGVAEAIRQGLPEVAKSALLATLQEQVRRAESTLTAFGESSVTPEVLEQIAKNSEELVDLWPRMTVEERRRALRALQAEVLIEPIRRGQRRPALDGRVKLRVPW